MEALQTLLKLAPLGQFRDGLPLQRLIQRPGSLPQRGRIVAGINRHAVSTFWLGESQSGQRRQASLTLPLAEPLYAFTAFQLSIPTPQLQ
jgi:hypothetical protein